MDVILRRSCFRNEIIWGYGLGGSSNRIWSRKHDIVLCPTQAESRRVLTFHKPTVPATSRVKGMQKGCTDTWMDIPSLNNAAKERTGYLAQKPAALYGRIIRASSDEGDLIHSLVPGPHV